VSPSRAEIRAVKLNIPFGAISTISETQHSSELLVAESTAEIAVPTNTAGKSSDSHSVDVATMEEELVSCISLK